VTRARTASISVQQGWDPARLPDLSGQRIVVTGANAGLGYFMSEQLAGAGAHIVLACRNEKRADAALAALRRRVPGASVERISLDTADPASVRAAAERILSFDRVDALVENAGMVHPPRTRSTTADGHEIVLATNLLGHFALAALTMPALERTAAIVGRARIVSMGSMASRLSGFRVDDLQLERGYTGWRAYAQSKIAVQSFGFELDRRLRAAGSGVESLVAHPGYSVGGLSPRIPGVNEPSATKRFIDTVQGVMAQSKQRGAWAAVRAVADADATGGQYWGPRFLVRGRPALNAAPHSSTDAAIAARLWAAAERYTGVPFTL
jgi:NAD(P)-dependent dehydrogenase (short-subunit alcohol dehydrogenase family)